MRLPVRPGPRKSRRRAVTRASAVISRVRLAAAFVMLVTAGGFHSLATSPVFALDPATIRIHGLEHTDPVAAQVAMGVAHGPNLFRLRTTDLVGSLRELPTVRDAHVGVRLPSALEVVVQERAAIMIWSRAEAGMLADVDGMLFAPAGSGEGVVPVIHDRRSEGVALTVGTSLPPLDLEVARLLGAVGPVQLASASTSLTLSVEDRDGWVLASPIGWRAVFGHYTVALRPPSQLDDQVACLAALLASGEAAVASVTLAVSASGCGTFREAPQASPSDGPRRGGDPSTRRP